MMVTDIVFVRAEWPTNKLVTITPTPIAAPMMPPRRPNNPVSASPRQPIQPGFPSDSGANQFRVLGRLFKIQSADGRPGDGTLVPGHCHLKTVFPYRNGVPFEMGPVR